MLKEPSVENKDGKGCDIWTIKKLTISSLAD